MEAVIRFEFLGAALPIAVLTCAWPLEANRERHPDDRVVVAHIHTSAVGNHVVARAKYVASKVLAGAGVTLEWASRPPDHSASECLGWISIGLSDHALPGSPPDAIAGTRLPASQQPSIEIFMDRVCMRTESRTLPEVLGHAIAHEIGHALQGVKRHSAEGVMKERWSRRDLTDMVIEPVRFAPEDIDLIDQFFVRRAARCQAGPPAAAQAPE